ncbi:MAG: hypothetical protein BZ136_03745 [Methanosphaera sp. rholeuAM74]|nr:MAG: hypothetical protein BZ136_03745 [Methanosphaera sp. rholeuAM74]
MSKLFKVPKQTILYHIHDIFETGEIEENSVVKEIMTADKDNKKYQTKYYNAEVIISLAYRINSTNAIQFRKWMTKILNEIIVKGHVLDEELLKNGRKVNKEYFDNILEIIQHIKTSKRRFDQKITDIYITSFDYDKNAEITKNFFQEIQNKLIHYVTGKTAKEIITTRSNDKENKTKCTNNTNHNDEMFLGYVIITKNYLNQEELSILNNLVDNLLALAENRAKNNILTNMNDWREITEEYFDSKQAYINV